MTLTAIATITRRTILISAILGTLGLIIFIGYQIWHANYLASLPKPEEQPTLKFGNLPSPNFAPSIVSTSNFSYQIATQTGGFPDFGKLVKVYFIPKPTATFLANDKAKALAVKLNFNSDPIATGGGYEFKKENQTLVIDTDSGNFDFKLESTPSASKAAPEQDLIRNFRTFLGFLGILKDELKSSPAKVVGKQILIWPDAVDTKPIVTDTFTSSFIRAEASASGVTADDYLSIHFTFWPVDQTTFSTYPIKTPQQAFEDLKKGSGSIVVAPKNPQVSITKVYLAYFESESYAPYLLPVFVFEAPGFVGYVPAITDQYTTKGN